MAGKHFVTVLGTGNYSECVYDVEDGQLPGNYDKTPTRFVQIAVLRYIIAKYGKKNNIRITVFATQTAEEKNWNSTVEIPAPGDTGNQSQSPLRFRRYGKKTFRTQLSGRTQEGHDQTALSKGSVRKGLEALLEEEFHGLPKQIVRIPEGKNRQEVNKIFEIIYQHLLGGDTVFFDFTHGLRNLPMLTLAVVNYAKVLKNVRVQGLYYGAFELGTPKERGPRHAQILDMTFCSTLQDWTSAAESFVKTGSSNQISALYQRDTSQDPGDSEYQDIVDRLRDLTKCLETSRGNMVPRNQAPEALRRASIDAACKCFQEEYKNLASKELSGADQHIERLIKYINNDLRILNTKELSFERNGQQFTLNYTAMGLAAVNWALKKKLIQQGFTALSETLVSFICELYGIPAGGWDKRTAVRRTLRSVSIEYEQEVYPLDVRMQYWLPNWEVRNDNLVYSFKTKATEILTTLPEKVFLLDGRVTKDRNSLNHFGYLNNDELIAYNVIEDHLGKRYREMVEIVEELIANPPQSAQ